MSIRGIFTALAKNMDKQNYKSVSNKAIIAEYKYQAITCSDKYFYFMDQGSDYEIRKLSEMDINDVSEASYFYKLIADKWIELSEEMKLLTPPYDLPADALRLFIDSHALLISSAKIRAQMNGIYIEQLQADFEENYVLSNEIEINLKMLKELDDELHQSYRNSFDTLLDYFNNL